MTAQLAPTPLFRAFDNNGNPLVSGQLFTYQAGTTTPQATYTDSTQVTPNTNPVILNARGEASVWLDPTKVYKFLLKDSLGNTIPGWPVDQIPGGIQFTQQGLGQILNPQIPAEQSAGITPTDYWYQPYDIRRYGADPTGAIPSDTAMTSAIAVCGTAGGTIRCPAGTYTFANQIALNVKTGITLQGDGASSDGAQPATTLKYTGSASPWINMDSSIGCAFRNLMLLVTNSGFNGGTLVHSNNDGTHGDPNMNGIYDCVIAAGVSATNFIHFDLDKHICFAGERTVFANGAPSIRGAQGHYSNQIAFRSCQWFNCASAPIQDGGQAWSFEGCTFEALNTLNSPAGAFFSTSSSNYFNGLKVSGCWFGDAGTGVGSWFNIYTQGCEISGNYISGNTTGTTAISLHSSFGVHIVGNIFDHGLTGINFLNACNDITFKSNVANSVTNPWANGNNVPTGGIDFGPNFGFGIPSSNHGSATATGYRVSAADGTIEQWGVVNPASHGNNTVTFPIAFPNACFNVQCTLSGVVSGAATIYATSLTASNFNASITDGTSTTDSFYWRAIGN